MKNGVKSILMGILALTFLIPISVFAQPYPPRPQYPPQYPPQYHPLYLTFKPGIYSPQSRDLEGSDTGFNGEIAFGFRFNPNIAAEFGIGYFNTEKEVTAVGATYAVQEKFNINVIPVTLTLKAILPYKRWELFGLAGGGVYIVSAQSDYHNDYYDNHYDYEYDSDAVMGGYLGGGLHYNIAPGIFVGVEGKYLWTDKAKLNDEAYGVPLEAKFKMDGIIATAVFGIRF